MIFGLLESFNDSPLLLYLGVISIACISGSIPMLGRRRRSIENQLPTFIRLSILSALAVAFKKP